jgi:hypothetical protein
MCDGGAIALANTRNGKEDTMKKWIGFVAGAVFTLAVIVTCGGGGSGTTRDAGLVGGPSDTGSFDSLIPRDVGVGEARAQATTVTRWEYANISSRGVFSGPAGTSLDCSTCGDQFCCANLAGPQGWELVAGFGQAGYETMYFKRPKQ